MVIPATQSQSFLNGHLTILRTDEQSLDLILFSRANIQFTSAVKFGSKCKGLLAHDDLFFYQHEGKK